MFFRKSKPRGHSMKITSIFSGTNIETTDGSLETEIEPISIHELNIFRGNMQFTKRNLEFDVLNVVDNDKYEPEIHYTVELTQMSNRESDYIKRLKLEQSNPALNVIQSHIHQNINSLETPVCWSAYTHTEKVVPLHCYTCWHSQVLPPNMRKNYERLKQDNPSIQFHLYDELMCREFIIEHFEKDVVDAYDKMVPSSYKSDLWRYCLLYKRGGIYLDIKYGEVGPSTLTHLCNKEYFALDCSNYWDENQYGIYTACMITKPGNPILMQCVREIVKNTQEEVYGWNALYPTGPGLLGKHYFDGDLKKHVNRCLSIELFYTNNQIIYQNKPVLKVYDEYRDEQQKYQNNIHYSGLWKQNAIYKKQITPIVERSVKMRNTELYSVALIMHIGNMDIFKEMKPAIDNVTSLQYKNYNLDIYFNVIDSINQESVEYLQHNYPDATIIQSENYGFDIGSFFHILDNIKTRGLHYDYVLKLHTKTDNVERNKLINSIVGSTNTIQSCIRLFEENMDIGCIGAKEAACLDSKADFERNVKYLQILLERYFPNRKHIVTKTPYISGTMFWMRFDLLKYIFMRHNMENIYNSLNNIRTFDWNWYYFANRQRNKGLPYNNIKLYEHYQKFGKPRGASGNLFHCIKYSTNSVVLRDAMIEHAYERFFSYMLGPMGVSLYYHI